MNPKLSTKNIVAIVIGNAIEVYDFVVYSFMSMFIASLFFPTSNETNTLLAALATFGVAFLMRPLGGVILGKYADTAGRKAAFYLVIALMFLSIFTIAFVPTYASIGICAPIIMVLARLLQGFAAGAVFSTSTPMLIEFAPSSSRGFYGSWQMTGQTLAIMAGATIGMLLTEVLTTEQIKAGGWRIPFFIGLLILPIGIYIRRNLNKIHLQEDLRIEIKSADLQKMIWQHLPQILIVTGVVIGGSVTTYINMFYMPTYAATYLNLPTQGAFVSLLIGLIITAILIPLFGHLSDKIGRIPILVCSIFIYLLLIYPLFFWLNDHPTLFKLFVVQVIFCSLLGIYFGPFPAFAAEQFPTKIRSTALGISYNLGVMLFGGFAQFFVTWLIKITDSPMAITYYLFLGTLLPLIALLFAMANNKLVETEPSTLRI